MNYLLLLLISITLSIFVGCEKKPSMLNIKMMPKYVVNDFESDIDMYLNVLDSKRKSNKLSRWDNNIYVHKEGYGKLVIDFLYMDSTVYVKFVEFKPTNKKIDTYLKGSGMISGYTPYTKIIACHLKKGKKFGDYVNYLINKEDLLTEGFHNP